MQFIIIQGRRSVEVTKIVEEFFGPPNESGVWAEEVHAANNNNSGCAKNTDCIL